MTKFPCTCVPNCTFFSPDAQVYNDDLEDDNDSWGGDNEEVEEEEDLEDEEDGAEGEDTPNNLSTENVGKKRKLDED